MPAVPSGRACDACRHARKKCDLGVPYCSRCIRLRLICVGSGQRRFQFKGPQCFRKPSSSRTGRPPTLQQSPTPQARLLLASLLKSISPETEHRFNLLHYGPFLQYVPQRLGTSEALDSAAQALVLSHHDICSGQSVSVPAITAYGTAVQRLKDALGKPTEASAIQSLGAAALLVICRDLNGFRMRDWETHTLGALAIVQARRHIQPQDEFEYVLLECLQGYLVGHCVFSQAIRHDPDRFEQLVESLAKRLEAGTAIYYIYNIPRLIQRGKMLESDLEATQNFSREVETAYQALINMRHKHQDDLDNVSLKGSGSRLQASAEYAFTLSACSIYHCILSGPKLKPTRAVVGTEGLVAAALRLAKKVEGLSPLGSAYMFMTLSTAWLCAEDAAEKLHVESAIRNLLKNYHRGGDISYLALRMEDLRRDLHFTTDQQESADGVQIEMECNLTRLQSLREEDTSLPSLDNPYRSRLQT